ncbi:MAG: hypothetical protein AAF366_04720 [Pseudomonadota bacterium]
MERLALLVSLGWLALVAWFFLTMDPDQVRLSRADPLGFVMTILGVFLPVALIWIAMAAARTARTLREESARLQAAIDAMRLSYVETQQGTATALRREVEERIAEVAKAQATLGAEMASLATSAAAPPVIEAPARPAPPAPQQVLALEPADSVEPEDLAAEDFIKALNFPDNDRDQEGFRVLRAALDHHPTADLVKAAQDVLTLLSQDGIYMDDLAIHRPDATVWRAFAAGARGTTVSDLAGVRDRSSLALTTGRMKNDAVFRDASHQFLRIFDKVFARFADTATDPEIARFGDTRTARAFMLIGKVAGSFG